MRIVSGKYRGRTLNEFDRIGVRPTSDKTRESLFNILRGKIEGKTFLDLFSGTGAMGIEAISEGARRVVFNDMNYKAIELINSNLKKLKVEEDYKVYSMDALRFIETCGEKFDYIYIDPPYESGIGLTAVEKAKDLLTDGGLIIYESDKEFDGEIFGLNITDRRKYGKNKLTFFKKD